MEQNKDELTKAITKLLKPSLTDYLVVVVGVACAVVTGAAVFIALYAAHPQAATVGSMTLLAFWVLSLIAKTDYKARERKAAQLVVDSLKSKYGADDARQD